MTISIVDFASLQTGIDNWLNRTDFNGTRDLDFIGLFEAWFVREAMRRGGLRELEDSSQTLTLSAQLTSLPAGFRGMRNIYLSSLNPQAKLDLSTQNTITSQYAGYTGQPRVYSIVGSQIMVGPTPDASYTAALDIYSFTGLSALATTNWLITSHPDLYLYGSLAEAEPFIKDGNIVGYWQNRRDEGMDSLFGASMQARWGGSPMVMRPDGWTP